MSITWPSEVLKGILKAIRPIRHILDTLSGENSFQLNIAIVSFQKMVCLPISAFCFSFVLRNQGSSWAPHSQSHPREHFYKPYLHNGPHLYGFGMTEIFCFEPKSVSINLTYKSPGWLILDDPIQNKTSKYTALFVIDMCHNPERTLAPGFLFLSLTLFSHFGTLFFCLLFHCYLRHKWPLCWSDDECSLIKYSPPTPHPDGPVLGHLSVFNQNNSASQHAIILQDATHP